MSGYYRTALEVAATSKTRCGLSDRPNIRVDNGNIADSGVITGVKSLRYGGAEAAGVFGPLTVAGEAGRLWLDRPDCENEAFTGFYGYAAYMLTGETRPFRGGNFDRVRPFKELGKDGLGAFEVGASLRPASTCRTRRCSRAPAMKRSSVTLGLNWYFNPYAKLMFNWVRFSGDNTPLDPVGSKTKGDAFATRLHLDF